MENWINKLPNKDILISKLKLPGTHHSAINKVSIHANEKLFNIVGRLKCIVDPMTVTQEHSVYKQLTMGVRFLDIRIAWWDNDIHVAHTYIGDKLEHVISEILKFNSQFPTEPIIIKFRIDNRNQGAYKKYKLLADRRFLNLKLKLDPIVYKESSIPTINYLIKSRKPLVILESILEIPYIKTTDPKKKFDNIMNYLRRGYDGYSLVDIALTPGSIRSISLKDLSVISNNYFKEFDENVWKNLNCMTVDYVDAEIIKYVVDLNYNIVY